MPLLHVLLLPCDFEGIQVHYVSLLLPQQVQNSSSICWPLEGNTMLCHGLEESEDVVRGLVLSRQPEAVCSWASE
jgi:hypothetical protein